LETSVSLARGQLTWRIGKASRHFSLINGVQRMTSLKERAKLRRQKEYLAYQCHQLKRSIFANYP
jgi:hypothetical protein